MSFAKNIGKNIGKNISKHLSGKYNQKLLDQVNQSATDPPKTNSKRVIQRTAEVTGDLILIRLLKLLNLELLKFREIHNKTIQRQI